MTRAEEAALKAFPDNDVLFFAEDAEGNYHPVKTFGREVNGFIFGYEQAEKDLTTNAIDAEIVKDIHNLLHVKSGPLPMPAKHRFGDRVKILILEDDERTPHNLD